MVSNGNQRLVLLAGCDVVGRNTVRTFLQKAGYDVLAAAGGKEALALSSTEPRTIDVLLTDTEMPQVDGLTTYRLIKRKRPHIKVLFVLIVSRISNLNLPPLLPFLKKPFGPEALRTKLKEVLDERSSADGEWTKVILVVDRNSERRERTKSILNENGYSVLSAASVEEAKAVSDSIAKIDLVISEVMVTGESGIYLAERVNVSGRGTSTLLISHFNRNVLNGVSKFETQPELLPNFFTAQALLARVRKLEGD